jgi:hypothetical protein
MTWIKLTPIIFALFLGLEFAYADIDASVSLTPANPAPYDKVILTLSSYSFDVNTSVITWKNGTKTLDTGMGHKTLTVSAGDAGQILPISYKAETADGSFVEGTINISPQSVDLIYTTNESYTPPFYEGRTLPGEGSVVQVLALPTISEGGVRLPASSLSYSWYVDDEYLDNASGAGKNTATILLDSLSDSTEVRVLVRSPRGNTAEKTISIYPHDVLPALYAYDDVLGTDFTKLFTRRLEIDQDITLSLEPYYLSSKKTLASSATYDWYLDGLPVTPLEKTLLVLKPKDNAYGARTLSVVVGNTLRTLQEAKNEIEIVFDTRK